MLVVVSGGVAIYFFPASEPDVGNMIYYEAPGRLFTQSFVVDVVVVVDAFRRRCCSLRSCESLTTPAASVSEPQPGQQVRSVDDRDTPM